MDDLLSAPEGLETTNALNDPFFIKDDAHRWVFLNDAAVRLMGRPRENLIGLSDHDLYDACQADVFIAHDRTVLESGEPDLNEEEITWVGGLRYISTKKSLYVDPASGRRYVVGTIRDITRRRVLDSLVFGAGETSGSGGEPFHSYDVLGIAVLVARPCVYGSRLAVEYLNHAAARLVGADSAVCRDTQLDTLAFFARLPELTGAIYAVWRSGTPLSVRIEDHLLRIYRIHGRRVAILDDSDEIGFLAEPFPPAPSPERRLAPDRPSELDPGGREEFDRVCRVISSRDLFRNDALSLDDLARRTGLRRNHLSALIHEHTGAGFYELINSYRIEAVRQELLRSDRAGDSVLDIAMEAGFASKSTFNKHFRTATGMTPREFRRRARREPSET